MYGSGSTATKASHAAHDYHWKRRTGYLQRTPTRCLTFGGTSWPIRHMEKSWIC
jgi:hypothetical protein